MWISDRKIQFLGNEADCKLQYVKTAILFYFYIRDGGNIEG